MAECIDESAVLRRALDTYGSWAQVMMVFEEMSELQKELCKYLRGRGSFEHIAEEIARAKAGSKPDTYVDLAGYAACGAEISSRDAIRSASRMNSRPENENTAGGEKTGKSEVKLQRMDGYYLVDVDGNPHRFTLWETAMQFIREHAGELT